MSISSAVMAHLRASSRQLTNAIPIDVSIVDGSGNQITSFGGGTGGTSAADESAFTVGSGFGTPAMGIFESSPTTLANGQVGLVGLTTDRKMKISGSFSAAPTTAATSTFTSVAENASNVTVLAANASRLAAVLNNMSNAACYLKYGATASSTSFTKRLQPGESHTVIGNYVGKIDAIWDSTPGVGAAAMIVDELTA